MGVQIRQGRVIIRFTWAGQRHSESIGKATTTAIAKAERLARELDALLDAGQFDDRLYRKMFPRSRRFKGVGITFGEIAQSYLDGAAVTKNSRAEYAKSLNRYWMPELATREIHRITPAEVRSLVNSYQWAGEKTRNNNLIPLRGVFRIALEDEIIESDPTARIRNLAFQKSPPDPFSRGEADQIITHLYQTGQHLAPWFEFAFYSGLRVSEQLALQWGDVDFQSGYVRVEKARSKGTDNAQTKTKRVRDVRLNDRSLHALQKMKAASFLAGQEVFVSESGEAYRTEKAQRSVFTRALKKLGVRHRPAMNTRHTYATMLLMGGVNPAAIAEQLGHSVTMTLTVYSKWLPSKDDDSIARALQSGEKLGRKNSAPS